MSLFVHPEGPPSSDDMQLLAFDLLFAGKIGDAHRLAAVMVDHWIDVQDHDEFLRAQRFGYWLGLKSATAHFLAGRQNRTARRVDRRRHHA